MSDRDPAERRFIRIISGESRGIGPALSRFGLLLLEPFYTATTAVRNRAFESGIRKVHRATLPVISVGNLTTGGTGKTPVVGWLCDALRRAMDSEIAILIRGYKAIDGESDEAIILRDLLAAPSLPAVHVVIGADRVAAASKAMTEHPGIRAFVMDDGFQHRRLHRDCDLVLIDATNPFGFDHVLPRGLLRESANGLRRAHAILITRADQVSLPALNLLQQRIAALNAQAPRFTCSHKIVAFRKADGTGVSVNELAGKRVAAFAGIANPKSFAESLKQTGCNLFAVHWFPDHHHFTLADIGRVDKLARESGAAAIVTTAKDAARLHTTSTPSSAPLLVAELQVQFSGDDGQRLLKLVLDRIGVKTQSLQPSRELVLKKLRNCFPDPVAAGEALTLLETYRAENECSRRRVQLAILKESRGDLARLRDLLKTAEQDFRDVLVGAEYPRQFAAPLNAPKHEIANLEAQDRREYESWLMSDRP